MIKLKEERMKGFTIIELLVVIVILAIIALIAVPVIMNIINKANKSAFKDTAYGIISAGELYFAERQLDLNGMSEDITITLPDTTNTLGLKGEVPEGTIIINKEGKIAIGVYNERYCITKSFDDTDVTVTEDYEKCKNPEGPIVASDIATTSTEVTSIPACLTDGSDCSNGTAVALQVNDTETYNFYVIDDKDGKLTLIMNKNLGSSVWISGTDYTTANTDRTSCSYTSCSDEGPLTAVAKLKERTSGWTNIEEREYTYSDDGRANMYTSFTETMRARMLTYTEATSLGCTTSSYSCPNWLYNGENYWFSTANFSIYSATYLNVLGYLSDNYYVFDYRGIRPVITISK